MMITRCLGPQIGTTVGLTFCLANLVASAMYLAGGAEVVTKVFGGAAASNYIEYPYMTSVICSSLMLLFLLVVSFFKVEKFFRTICLLLTLMAVINVIVTIIAGTRSPNEAFTGISGHSWRANWDPQFDDGYDFSSALSILFPGVSGLMSGVCLSGDLKHGAKAIPRGIGYAWVLSLVTYLVMAVLIAGSFDRTILKGEYRSLHYASYEPLFLPGEFCASFAAVLAMMIGSSRVLRAIGRDKLLPWRWVHFIGDRTPREVAIMFWVLIQGLLFTGNTYAIASAFATQVFCANFLALNLSTFLSAVTGIASFRPVYSFFNSVTALVGAFLCLALMFFISPLVCGLVLLFMLLLLVLCDTYIDSFKLYWGDASQPLFFYLVRKWLLRLDERKEHIRHWRPSIMQIVTDPLCSMNLMHLGNNLKKGGLYELCVVIHGDFHETIHACHQWKGWLMDFIQASGIKAFGVVNFGKTLRHGVQNLLRTVGLGGMRPNTVLLSIDEILQRESFLNIYRTYQGEASHFGSMHHIEGVLMASKGFGAVRPLKDVHNNRSEFFGADSLRRLREAGSADQQQGKKKKSIPPAESPTSLCSYNGGPSPTMPHDSERMPLISSRSVTPPPQPKRVAFIQTNSDPMAEEGQEDLLAQTICIDNNVNSDGEDDPMSPGFVPKPKRVLPTEGQEGAAETPSSAAGGASPAGMQTRKHGGSIIAHGVQSLRNWSEWLRKSQLGEHLLQSSTDHNADAAQPQQPLGTVGYRTYASKKATKWGLFRTSRGEANEDAESLLVERLVAHRHMAMLTQEADLSHYSDITEFCAIAKDVGDLNMNLILARNMDKLDKAAVMASDSKRFIDIWVPHETDAIMFLMAHCFALTSVWRKHAMLRVVQVVTYNDEMDERLEEWRRNLKFHRITAETIAVSLENEASKRNVSIANISAQFEDDDQRPLLLNALIQAECEANGHRTAVVMLRVNPYKGKDDDDDAAEAWFSSLVNSSNNLPPTLLVSGGSIKCRSSDW